MMPTHWPEIFNNPDMDYYPELRNDPLARKGAAIADGLCGWANCMAGFGPPPKGFGMGMVRIGEIAGCFPTAEELHKACDLWKKEWDARKRTV